MCGAALAPAQAQQAQVLSLDRVRSHAAFEVKVLYFIGVHGEFGAVHGALHVDHAHQQASVEAGIAADGLHMRSRRYENWAKSAEFFDATHFPQIYFTS